LSIFTDQSLRAYLVTEDWKIDDVEPRFMPLSLKSKDRNVTLVVP
jgi:hypothetical protein